MLYYSFECNHCKELFKFSGSEKIFEFRDTNQVTCPFCKTENPYDHRLVASDGRFYATGIGWVYPETDDRQGYQLPTPDDMEPDSIDLENCEDWQREILKEFTNAHGVREDNDYDLEEALIEVKSHQFGFAKFGAWAYQFKLKRLYKNMFSTWKQFCEKVLHKDHWYVDKKIRAARVIKDLICAGFTVLPKNEYQCRPLTKFWGEELIDNWAMIVDAVQPHLITSDLIKSRFCSREPRDKKWLKVDGQLWEEFA